MPLNIIDFFFFAFDIMPVSLQKVYFNVFFGLYFLKQAEYVWSKGNFDLLLGEHTRKSLPEGQRGHDQRNGRNSLRAARKATKYLMLNAFCQYSMFS